MEKGRLKNRAALKARRAQVKETVTQKDKRRERYQHWLSSRKALAGSKRVAVAIDGGGARRRGQGRH